MLGAPLLGSGRTGIGEGWQSVWESAQGGVAVPSALLAVPSCCLVEGPACGPAAQLFH